MYFGQKTSRSFRLGVTLTPDESILKLSASPYPLCPSQDQESKLATPLRSWAHLTYLSPPFPSVQHRVPSRFRSTLQRRPTKTLNSYTGLHTKALQLAKHGRDELVRRNAISPNISPVRRLLRRSRTIRRQLQLRVPEPNELPSRSTLYHERRIYTEH